MTSLHTSKQETYYRAKAVAMLFCGGCFVGVVWLKLSLLREANQYNVILTDHLYPMVTISAGSGLMPEDNDLIHGAQEYIEWFDEYESVADQML